MSGRRRIVAVIGSGTADEALTGHAHDVGAVIGRLGYALVTGGLGGVMQAASEGFQRTRSERGAVAIALLPGDRPEDANAAVEIAIPTGFGRGRNLLVVRAARCGRRRWGRERDAERDRLRLAGGPADLRLPAGRRVGRPSRRDRTRRAHA